ncbi:MAG: type II secretion system F family protein [Candidatus Omnitrophica bacterium]|nr:type II secretion system F family protein [Candidatus Omnitrophota bacterium]
MKYFSYVVKDQNGKVLKGVIEAEAQEKVIAHFHKQGYIIFSISESKKKKVSQKKGKVHIEDLVVFSRQFTTLIESGIPVVECLSILEEQVENAYFRKVISDVLKDVREGAALSSALSKHKDVFPEIYLSMVEAAEISGNLPAILDRVSVYLEKSNALRKKVISALYYPVVVMLMAVGITGFLLVKIVPTFKDIFAGLGRALPLPTQILINISDFLTSLWVIVALVGGGVVGSILFGKFVSTPKGKKAFHRFILMLPVFGELIKRIAIAKFSRTFATLVKSGVSIVKCLDIVGKTSGNKIIEDAVFASQKSIQEGQPISVPLGKTGVFPVMVVKMIAVGEKSGRLEDMLSKIAEFYEEQTDAMVAGLASLIEPIVIAFLGIVVGGIVVALFMPIIGITQHLTGH